jgi:23S rRNA pseudouridine2605 synthase
MLGVCSRREADKLIISGDIQINGTVCNELGSGIIDGDLISVRGIEYFFRSSDINARVWLYYKPKGLIVTHHDKMGRKTIFDDLKTKINGRVISVGRLDLNSEGLLILTNSGEFARYAESPRTAWERCYNVRIFGKIDQTIIKNLRNGTIVNGVRYRPMIIKKLSHNSGINCLNYWVDCILHEGKNREIRKLFGHFGIMVNRLIRYKFGPYELRNLKSGEVQTSFIQKADYQ